MLPTTRTVRQLVREILSRCEALQIARIAIPALATGAARLSPLVSAQTIAQALREHAVNRTVLQYVVLPIPEPTVYQAFAKEIALPFLEEITLVPVRRSSRPPGTDRVQVEYSVPMADTGRRADRGKPSPEMPPPTLARRSRLMRWLPGVKKAPESTKTTNSLPPGSMTKSALPSREIPPSLFGQTFRPLLSGRYVLLEELGRGGMSVVFLSWDLVLRRIVAIKVLRPDTADPDSLKREAAAALELTHEGIVRLYHFEPAEAEREAYLVMEYLSWPSGEKWVADAGVRQLPVRAVIDVGVRICGALAHAHGRNIIHLDIKPSNIFVDPAGESAKLGDFGLARTSGVGGKFLQLQLAGTPAYMAPEQATSFSRVSAATDVYQLGATLWDFLTGRPPRREMLDLQGFEPDRQRLLSILRGVLTPEPAIRPSAARLAEMISSAA